MAIAGTARAQIVNVLDPSKSEQKTGFGFVLEESLSLRSGNSSTLDLRTNVASQYRGKNHLFMALLVSEFSRADGVNTANHHFGHLRWKFNQSPQVAIFSFVQMEQNDKQDIKSRSLIGAGLEYSYRPTSSSRTAIAASVMPEYEVLKGFKFDDGEYRTRLSFYLSGILEFTKNSRLASTTFYQPQIDDWDFFRVLVENSLYLNITSRVALKTSFDVAHNSRPPEGIDRTDVTLLQGVSVSL